MHRPVIIKIGGAPARDAAVLSDFAGDLSTCISGNPSPGPVLVVHGGGAEVTGLSTKLGIETHFEDGVRLTGEDEMPIVDMVLCGLVNKRIVRTLGAAGVPSVGISAADGRLVLGDPVSTRDGGPSFTATPGEVNPAVLHSLWKDGWVPVVASPGVSPAGTPVNINADEVTLAVGEAVNAAVVVFISDVDGVLDSHGTVINRITLQETEHLVLSGVVHGGMVPKIRSAARAVGAGVGTVVIGRYRRAGDLADLLSGRTGTSVTGEES